ncbi:crossover junction endonuclease MUS81-like [Ptychodera flava]|uniref:crossover junction endonuclease MUS81-like n=1 Tax=Ptychodera flava TaxID=63121 RepID=UPI003969D52F
MSYKQSHRGTKKTRPCPNPLFLQWLTEWYDTAADNSSKMQYVYAKAIDSLKKYPLPLRSGKEAKILQGFGDKICKMLDKKMLEHGITPSSPVSVINHGPQEPIRDEISRQQTAEENQSKKKRVTAKKTGGGSGKTKEYIPAYRSGAYALILTLYSNLQRASSRGYMTKAELMREAQSLCDKSLSQPDPGCRYTAWSSMGTLVKKGYVMKDSNPAKYSLTDSGCELANKLQAVASSPERQTAPSFTITGPVSVSVISSSASHTERTCPSSRLLVIDEDDDDDDDAGVRYKRQGIHGANDSSDDDCQMIVDGTENETVTRHGSLHQSTDLPRLGFEHPSGSSQSSVGLDGHNGNSQFSLTSEVSSQSTLVSLTSEGDSSLPSSCSVSTPLSDIRPEFILQPGNFDVVLCVDNCETAGGSGSRKQNLLPELRKNGINFDVRKLQVGDFLWIAKERIKPKPGSLQVPVAREIVLDYIVERKRMDDLASSIMDGRFKEQKFRLKNCGLRKPIYLVEDLGCSQHFSIPETTLQQAIVNTQVTDGFYIKHTHSQKESVGYLTIMTRYLQSVYANKTLVAYTKDHLNSLQSRPVASDHQHMLMTFGEFNELTVKNKAMTVTEMFAKQLMQISGLSAEKAKVILEKYRTPKQLMEAYQNCQGVGRQRKTTIPSQVWQITEKSWSHFE